MSRLTDLMRQLHAVDPQLGADLETEIRALTSRRNFGLVFERHQPEAVELPGVAPKRGSKVRILEPRGSVAKGDHRLWLVDRIARDKGVKTAHLVELSTEEPEEREATVNDLIVVAEFKDGIFPGLVETGRVERGGDKPFHTVINAENFHALEMLTYTHRGKVDAIYIDPPYNTGAKDWKYNNDYVEGDDAYRHSKWLAMLERRLLIAKELLNPEDSVLIVTIDEKEYLRLGMLLEQVFEGSLIQMASIVHNPGGAIRVDGLNRVNEFAYYVFLGDSRPEKVTTDYLPGLPADDRPAAPKRSPIWRGLLRGGSGPLRSDSPLKFYPILIDESGRVVGHGDPLPLEADRRDYVAPAGTIAVWPLKQGGVEGRWELKASSFEERRRLGYVRAGDLRKDGLRTIYYLRNAEMERLASGELISSGMNSLGYLDLSYNEEVERATVPKTVWNARSHNATEYGSNLLKTMMPGRKFPYPKSLYAVEDSLRFMLTKKKEAIVLDFFSGSGTTAHAVMRLNKQDGGRRQCISITNNEVSAEEQKKLRKQGLRPGDPEWEVLGICDYITKPRVTAAITGKTPDGEPIKGDYKFTDKFPMADGFEENAAFFTLTYESPLSVRHGRAFERVAPMLWLHAGSQGRIITSLGAQGWDVSEVYAVLDNFNESAEFFEALAEASGVRMVFFVTDDDAVFQMACRKVPEDLEPVRLYSSYLQNFEISRGRA